MTRDKLALAVAIALGIPWLLWERESLKAQISQRSTKLSPETSHVPVAGTTTSPSIGVALNRPLRLPFPEPTPLKDVASYLQKNLGSPVVLDLAALDRLNLTADATVRLDLDGVRLQTGLPLLLDQVGLAYRVIPEDNLLILTDPSHASDPGIRALEEIKGLHRDIHDLQDTVDELFQALVPEEGGPTMKNPTIIEEVPESKPKDGDPTPRARPG